MAPEVMLNKPYNEKVDIFSLGIILYEVRARRPCVSLMPCPLSQKVQRAACVCDPAEPDCCRGGHAERGKHTDLQKQRCEPHTQQAVLCDRDDCGCNQVFTRSVTGVVLLSSNDEAECEMFAWKVRPVPFMSPDCTICSLNSAPDSMRDLSPSSGPGRAGLMMSVGPF